MQRVTVKSRGHPPRLAFFSLIFLIFCLLPHKKNCTADERVENSELTEKNFQAAVRAETRNLSLKSEPKETVFQTTSGGKIDLSSQRSRAIPDTTQTVSIWADQLNTYNDSQNRFVAANFVGSQKLTKNRINAIRQYNADFIVLQYHKAYGVDIGDNIVGPNEWGPDVATMNEFAASNPQYGDLEDYYIHWTSVNNPDHRVQHYWAGNLEFHLADVHHTGFRDYMINETTKRCEEIGFDGTFFDVAYFPWYEYEPDYNTSVGFGGDSKMWYEYAPLNWPSISQNASTLAENWNALVVPYWQTIFNGYHTQEADYYCIVNCDRMVTGWYEHQYLGYVDGAMSENWMTGGGENSRLTGGDWQLSASRILRYITGNDKILIAQPNNRWSENIALREWWIANYLLLKNHKSFYFYAYSMDVYWWPEYEIDLGSFLNAPTKNLGDLLLENTDSLYARPYEKGLVLVNPGESSQQYALEGYYYRYTFSGGGYVEANTKPAMTIEHSAPMNGTVSVEPHTALILRKETSDATIYVSQDGSCENHTPCFSRIEEAINWDRNTFTIKVEQGNYDESINLNQLKTITIQGGWNSSFNSQTPNTTFMKAPKALQGSIKIQELTIIP
jgi:hypothetical protein